MKNILLAAGIAALLLFPLSACGDVSRQSEISREIQLDLSGGTQVSDYDTHSGNGDGISCTAFDFSEHPLTPELEASPAWTSFPLSTTAKALVYGILDENSSTGPYLTDGDGVPLVPVFIGRDKRLFHRVSIIIGKPYDPVYTGRKGTAEEYQSNAEEIMRRAYALGGIQWQR